MSGDILDQIDHALEDWGTSPDAMRWTPEPQPAPHLDAWAALAETYLSPLDAFIQAALMEAYRTRFDDMFASLWGGSTGVVPEPPAAFLRQQREEEARSLRSEMFGRYYSDAVIGASIQEPVFKFTVSAT